MFSEYWIGWDFMYPSATDYQYGEIAPALSMRWYGGTYATQPTYDLYFIVETDRLLRVDTIPYEGDGVAAVANFGMGFDFIVD